MRGGFPILLLIFLSGCAPSRSQPAPLAQALLDLPGVQSVSTWKTDLAREPGLRIETAHYLIYTTLDDAFILRQTPVFLEFAFAAYRRMAGEIPIPAPKLPVYFFATRSQWETFTRRWAGPTAPTYLRIRSGAYYSRGACVAWRLEREQHFGVLAHEGWHQFAERFFACRLPAWLDEGIATNFEAYRWERGQVHFDPTANRNRLRVLAQAAADQRLFSLAELVGYDAGRLLDRAPEEPNRYPEEKLSPAAIYYAQIYALVRFLREENRGQYAARLERLLAAARAGRLPLTADLLAESLWRDIPMTRRWNAQAGREVFERGISANWSEIEHAYEDFCRKLR